MDTARPLVSIIRCGPSADRPLALARAQAYAAAAGPAGWDLVDPTGQIAEPTVAAVVLIGAGPTEISSHLARGRAVLLDGGPTLTRADAEQMVSLVATHRHPVLIGDELLHTSCLTAALGEATRIGSLTSIEARSLHPVGQPPPATSQAWNDLALPAVLRVLLALRRLRTDGASITWDSVRDSSRVGRRHLSLHGRLMGSPGTSGTPGTRVTVIVGEHSGRSVIQDIQLAAATGVVRGELMPDVHLEVDGEPHALPAPVHSPAQLEVFGMIPMLDLLRQAVQRRTQPLTGPTLLAEALGVTEWAWAEGVDPSR